MNNLIIAAHPDDEVLGCGGIIKKFSKTQNFYVLILTDGTNTRYKKSFAKKLRENALCANDILGTKDVIFENLPNQNLDNIPLTKVIKTIEKYLYKYEPNHVFTHSNIDLNQDHRIVHKASLTALRPIIGQKTKKVYSYFVNSSSEWNMLESYRPNTFIDIKNEIKFKKKAMEYYSSECRDYPHPRSSKAIEIYSNYFGLSSGFEFAEPFKLMLNISGDL